MTGLFEVIAADQSHQVVAGRKAVALSAQRVNEKFSRFLLAAEDRDDLDARLALVEDEMNGIVSQTCEEMGYDGAAKIAGAIWTSYKTTQNGGEPYPTKTASTQHEARKPKMCPYHKEVTDISLAAGRPEAGYEAMQAHAWGKNHCQGEFDGSCNFRSEMTTQAWWDDRDKAIQERREQREQERAEQEAQEQAEAEQLEQVEQQDTEPVAEEPVSDSEAPATESDPELGVDTESPAEAVTEAPTGVAEDAGMAMASSFREAEAVKQVDVTQRKGPSPKIDKRPWTVDNLQQRVDTEGEGSPNPTRTKDVVKPVHVTNNDRRHPETLKEVGEAVTEKQDVSKDSGPKPTDRRTWPTGEISAVSASQQDVDKNPLQDLLESEREGFVSPAVVQSALRS